MSAQRMLHLPPMCDKPGCWNRTNHESTDDRGHTLRACSIEHHKWLLKFRRNIYTEQPKGANDD